MDISQQMILAPMNHTGSLDFEQIEKALVGNAKVAYLTITIACGIATVLTSFQYGFLVFWHWKTPEQQQPGRGLVALIAYISYATSSYYGYVQRKFGHITRGNFLYSLVPRTVLGIVLPLYFVIPILSTPKRERPYRRVGVIPAAFVGWTLTFSSLVVVLDRGVTYGESHTLEKLELAQALVSFVLSMRLRRVPLKGYWPILRRSLFLIWLPPVQRLFIHAFPTTMPGWLLNGDGSTVTISEVKDSFFGALVIFEALAFSTSVVVFSIRNKSAVKDAEAAEPTEQASSPSEKEKVELPETVVESQDKPVHATNEGADASLI
jgi:uncharacterized membrane protein